MQRRQGSSLSGCVGGVRNYHEKSEENMILGMLSERGVQCRQQGGTIKGGLKA